MVDSKVELVNMDEYGPVLEDASGLRRHIQNLNAHTDTLRAALTAAEQRAERAEFELHARPTEWAYVQACAAIEKHQKRAAEAESDLSQACAELHASDDALTRVRGERDVVKRELAESRRFRLSEDFPDGGERD